jgi:hypothetical protein
LAGVSHDSPAGWAHHPLVKRLSATDILVARNSQSTRARKSVFVANQLLFNFMQTLGQCVHSALISTIRNLAGEIF